MPQKPIFLTEVGISLPSKVEDRRTTMAVKGGRRRTNRNWNFIKAGALGLRVRRLECSTALKNNKNIHAGLFREHYDYSIEGGIIWPGHTRAYYTGTTYITINLTTI